MAWAWGICLILLIGGAMVRLYNTYARKPAPEWDWLLFGVSDLGHLPDRLLSFFFKRLIIFLTPGTVWPSCRFLV